MVKVKLSLVVAVLLLCVGAATVFAQSASFALPGDNLFPEGIAASPNGDFYVGSTTSGQILRGNVNSGEVKEFLPGGADGRTDVRGIKVTGQGRLYAAGGPTGQMFVYDLASQKLLAKFATGVSPTFVNDVSVAPNGDAYFTDSNSPFVYRVAADVTKPDALEKLDVKDSIPYAQGFNLNGIAATPDGKYVITVQSNAGKLWRVDTASKAVTEVDLGGETVQAGDGLLLDGQTLYAMRNAAKELVTIRMTADFAKGTVVNKTTNQGWDFPTTFARLGDRLLILNSQLNKRTANQPPTLPFTAVTAPVPSVQVQGSGAQPAILPTTGERPADVWSALLTLGALLAVLGVAVRHRLARR